MFISCNTNDDINNTDVSTELSAEDYGKIHNEVVIELINSKIENQNNQELLKSMTLKMSEKYPTLFNINDYKKISKYFSAGVSRYSSKNEQDEFKFNETYTLLRQDVLEKGASEDIINFYDDMFNQFKSPYANKSSEKTLEYYKSKLVNHKEIKSYEIFNSIYMNSKELWTKTAPKEYLLNSNLLRRGCDPDQQVILADAIAGGLLSLISGPGRALGGGAASYLVREQQIQNGGGCI